jgi:hypothetical protein
MKLSVGALEGNLKTQNIDGLAKTIDSLKKYQVVSIIGNGDNQGETITISIDGNQVGTAVVKSDGTWIFASNFDPASDHEIKATKGENTRTLKYTASDKKLTTDSSLRAEVKSLFSNVETTHYTREGDIINFDLKANFDEKALW